MPVSSAYSGPPVRTVAEAIERMEQLQAYIVANEPLGLRDGVGQFNFLYTTITKKVLSGIENGRFADEAYLRTLDVAFANRYLDALRTSVERIQTVPATWRVLIRRRSDPRVAAIQFAIAGVNAHINFDLPAAVYQTSVTLGGAPDSGTRRSDYLKVNKIIAEEMQRLRRHFETGMHKVLDQGKIAQVLNIVGNFSVVEARDLAWNNAGVLWALRDSSLLRSQFTSAVDGAFGPVGHLLLSPVL